MHGTVVRRPELNALLEIDFAALAVGQLDEHAESHLVKISDGVWRWRGRCPSCYDFTVPEVQQQMPSGFAELKPKVLRRELIDFEPRQLEMPSGIIGARRPVRLDYIEMATLLTYEEEKAVQFFACDPPVHDNYLLLWRKPEPVEG